MYLKTSLIFLGILHGFTNLGGSLLTIISSNISNNNPVRRSPGVYIGDTRAFSSDNNPWNKVGTALTTSAEEVSIGELAFLDGTNSMVITGIGTDIRPVSGEVASSFTHKIPIKVQDASGNQESYFLLLTQNWN